MRGPASPAPHRQKRTAETQGSCHTFPHMSRTMSIDKTVLFRKTLMNFSWRVIPVGLPPRTRPVPETSQAFLRAAWMDTHSRSSSYPRIPRAWWWLRPVIRRSGFDGLGLQSRERAWRLIRCRRGVTGPAVGVSCRRSGRVRWDSPSYVTAFLLTLVALASARSANGWMAQWLYKVGWLVG